MQYQPVVRILAKLSRDQPEQSFFDFQRGFARCDTGAVGNPENMRIDGDGCFAEGGIQDDVGGLAADPGQAFEFDPGARDLARIFFLEHAAGGDDVFRLGVVQTDAADVFFQAIHAESEHRRWRSGDRVQAAGRFVHADIGGLRGKDDGNQ